MTKDQIIHEFEAITTHLAGNITGFAGKLASMLSEAHQLAGVTSELESAAFDVFKRLRAEVLKELGAGADVFTIEKVLAAKLRTLLEPENLPTVTHDLVTAVIGLNVPPLPVAEPAPEAPPELELGPVSADVPPAPEAPPVAHAAQAVDELALRGHAVPPAPAPMPTAEEGSGEGSVTSTEAPETAPAEAATGAAPETA